MTGEEEWRPVVGWEGHYEVSDHGRVRSIDRFIFRSDTGTRMPARGQMRRLYLDSGGYPRVGLSRSGLKTTRLVHHLVLEAFIGPRPGGDLYDGCHYDGNPANNVLGNLRWGTRSENARDIIRHGRSPMLNRTACPRGHALAPPNLVASEARRGRRGCLACARARASIQRAAGAGVDLVTLANERYAAILGTAS